MAFIILSESANGSQSHFTGDITDCAVGAVSYYGRGCLNKLKIPNFTVAFKNFFVQLAELFKTYSAGYAFAAALRKAGLNVGGNSVNGANALRGGRQPVAD